MNIRLATLDDFEALYELGKNTPEFTVSKEDTFMDSEEFKYALTDPSCVFLLAEIENRPIGFIYANMIDYHKPLLVQDACLVYLTIIPEFRRAGLAKQLYDTCVDYLKKKGATGIYGWANTESDGAIINFLEREGFDKGHTYTWMDKKF